MSKIKYLEQLSVFIENRTGELYSITALLERENISLLSITLSDSSEFGILRILTKEVKRSKELLIKNGFMAQTNKIIAVRIADKIGCFNKILKILNEAAIEIRYTYTINEKNDGIFVFKIEDARFEDAAKLLEQNGVKTISAEDL